MLAQLANLEEANATRQQQALLKYPELSKYTGSKVVSLHEESRFHKSEIRTIFNKKFCEELIVYFPCYETELIENDVSNNAYIAACVFVTAVTFLSSRCLGTIGGFLPNRSVT
jgi:hypothetical protein